MEEDWNGDVNPTTILPYKGTFYAAISQHNVFPKHLMTLLHILSCFPINMFSTLLLREQACKTLQECRM